MAEGYRNELAGGAVQVEGGVDVVVEVDAAGGREDPTAVRREVVGAGHAVGSGDEPHDQRVLVCRSR